MDRMQYKMVEKKYQCGSQDALVRSIEVYSVINLVCDLDDTSEP